MEKTKMTKTQLRAELHGRYLNKIADVLRESGEEVLQTKVNQLCIPCLNAAGLEEYVTITFSVPTGERSTKTPYDGYAEAENFKFEQAEAKAKAEANAKAKAEKIERDKRDREAKAAARAKHTTKKEEEA